MSAFSRTQMIWSSVRHSWRISLAVSLGVSTATAVIVGALLVGDSMRGSLRELTTQRLGNIDSAVIPGGFFSPDGIVQAANSTQGSAYPLMLFPSGSAEHRVEIDASKMASQEGSPEYRINRAGGVQILGIDQAFWDLDTAGVAPKAPLDEDSVYVNQALADELDVEVGDEITVRLPVEGAVPADSPLGRRDLETEGIPRLTVKAIVPDRGLGRFSLGANQAAPRNLFIARSVIGEVLDRDQAANALLFDYPVDAGEIRLELADYGLKLERRLQTFGDGDQPVYDYWSVTSDRLLVPDVAVTAIRDALPKTQTHSITTYLANAIETVAQEGKDQRTVPYSIVTATKSLEDLPLDFTMPSDVSAKTAETSIPVVINSWTAERLDAKVGTPLRIAYYEPEVEDGNEIERTFAATVTQIVPVTEPARPYNRRRDATFDKPPTVYNNPNLTPTVPGVTDQASISDWDLPFQLEREINSDDDAYWNNYRLTPKAFIPLEEGRRLFGSRFGQTTSLKIDRDSNIDVAAERSELEANISEALESVRGNLGWDVIRLRDQQLAASSGTTPFDGLFLSLSSFVIFSAVMLIAMLFRLGLTSRLPHFGTLMAVGWTQKQVSRLASAEGMITATIGVALGITGGIGYAMFVLWALRNWWVGAVTVPFLQFHWTPLSLVIGATAGWIVAYATIRFTVRSILKSKATALLAGRDDEAAPAFAIRDQQSNSVSTGPSRRIHMIAAGIGTLAVGCAIFGAVTGGQAAAGGFVGGGMLLLMAILLVTYARLKYPKPVASSRHASGYSVGVLADRNAARNPLRSTLTIGLMATASFLIIAIGAFELQPTSQGTGGFNLIAQSSQPLYRVLSDQSEHRVLLGSQADQVDTTTFVSLRLRPGQDASCNNLYRASQPTVVGVPPSIDSSDSTEGKFGFAFAATKSIAGGQTAWSLLDTPATGTVDDPIPMILDQNTAMWSFQMMKGVGETKAFEYREGHPLHFEVVGLLSNSVMQGKLLIGESNFTTAFPDISGYRYFLIQAPDKQKAEVSGILEDRLGDIGMDVSDSAEVLSGMLAVQNTYLKTFQSLGGLGLLLGTIGLAIAQMRNVIERRREIAVMRAIGFTNRRVSRIVMRETFWLLVIGIGCGALCAALAVVPHALSQGITPPVIKPLLIVAAILAFGMLAGLFATSQVNRMPLRRSLATS